MKNLLIALTAFTAMAVSGAARSAAQSMDDLNLQVHGYATQGFIYTNHNSWDTTDSSGGSPAWTEAVVNLSMQPQPKLRIGIQARFYILGDYGNEINLDWAQVDYKVNERFGLRVGNLKTPIGLLNETQDIDPVHLWVLLPQSIYPIASRNSLLDYYGGGVYGTVPLGERMGKLEYRAFAGQRILGSDDGYFDVLRSNGLAVPNGITGKTFGGTMRWNTPLPGLMVGSSEESGATGGEINAGPMRGTLDAPQFRQTFYFGRYEHNKVMIAGEYSRLQALSIVTFPGVSIARTPVDQGDFYGMASYRLSGKLTGGLYYSSFIDRRAAFDSHRYQKDWALAARYDFSTFLYAKAEQHFIDGTAVGFSPSDNPNLQPTTRMTMLKLGVIF